MMTSYNVRCDGPDAKAMAGYRPQRSWGKVMFLQVCVILFTGGGGEYLTRYPPRGPGTPPRDQVHPPGTRYTPRDQVHPPGTRYTPPWDQVHPPRTRYTPPGPGTPPRTRYTPRDQVHPRGPGTPPGTRYTPRDQVHPPQTRYPPQVNSNFFNSNFF